MAGDESRTNTSLNEARAQDQAQVQADSTSKESSSSSSWLQLSIGCQTPETSKHDHDQAASASASASTSASASASASASVSMAATGSGLVELDLLPVGGYSYSTWRPSLESQIIGSSYTGASSSFSTPLHFQQSSMANAPIPFTFVHHPQRMNWAFGSLPPHTMGIIPSSSSWSSSQSSSSCPSLRPLGSFFPTPFHFPPGFDVAGPSSDFRVVEPPRRPHSGIWFTLQASPNQAKEPFLPQIPKSYLRIKDGRLTVRLLLKYLVNKLRLESESEVEITCRGQQLAPFLTLQHVRDNIWNPRRTLLSGSSAIDHVMVLHYGRSA